MASNRSQGIDSLHIVLVVVVIVAVAGSVAYLTISEKAPAKFEISNLTITPSEVDYGEPATVFVDVTNTGDVEGDYALVLKVDNNTENTRETSVVGGGTETIHFDVTFDYSGEHTISVGKLSRYLEVAPTGELERREKSGLSSHLSPDPWDDLLTGGDVPDSLVEQSQVQWEFDDNFWSGVPIDHAAFRYWMDSAGETAVGVMGFVCPTESDARDILRGLGNYWRESWISSYPTGDFSHTPFPLYGEERESFKLTIPQGEVYVINFRIQNVTVGVLITQMQKSEAENYLALVEERIQS